MRASGSDETGMRHRPRGPRGGIAAARLSAGLLGIALVAGPATAQGASPSGRAVAQHGAWSIVCDRPPGATGDQCGAVQRVVSEERPDLGLTVIVFETADRAARELVSGALEKRSA